MDKDFNKWFELKPKINLKKVSKNIFVTEGQIWWCSLGANVGIETDGKDEDFVRPVIIIRAFSREHAIVLPIASESKNSDFVMQIDFNQAKTAGYVLLSQARSIGTERLVKYIHRVSPEIYKKIRERFVAIF